MSDMNYFHVIGRLTTAADLSHTQSGQARLKFSIAVNKRIKKDNQYVNKANFFNCVMWGAYAETMSQYMTKGKQIAVSGELSQDQWTDNAGVKHNGVTFVANDLQLLSDPRGITKNEDHSDGNVTQDSNPEPPEPSDPAQNGDIPF